MIKKGRFINTKKIFSFFSVLILLSSFVSASLPAYSQDSEEVNVAPETTSSEKSSWRGMIVSPAVLEIYPEKGSTYNETYKIENDTKDHIYTGHVVVQTFAAGKKEGKTTILEMDETNSYKKDWIKISDFDETEGNDNQYVLAPGESKQFDISFSVPQDANGGGHYFSLAFETMQFEDVNTGAGAAMRERIGTLVFMDVRGQAERGADFETFIARRTVREDDGFFMSDGKVDVEATFEADEPWAFDPFFDEVSIKYALKVKGETYAKPTGNIFVGNPNKKEPDFDINPKPKRKIVMPGQPRTFYILSDKPSDEEVKSDPSLIEKVTVGEVEKKWFGTQKITAKVFYLDSDGYSQTGYTEMTIEVFFFPWKTLLLALTIFAVIIVVWFVYRTIKKSKEKEEPKKVKTS